MTVGLYWTGKLEVLVPPLTRLCKPSVELVKVVQAPISGVHLHLDVRHIVVAILHGVDGVKGFLA